MTEPVQPQQEPVDRARRARLISHVVMFSLGTSLCLVAVVSLGLAAPAALPIIEVYIDSMVGLAIATTLAYVGGSVVDYNGGVGGVLGRDKGPKG